MAYQEVFCGEPLESLVAGFLLNVIPMETIEAKVLDEVARTDQELTLTERLVSTEDRAEKQAAIVEYAASILDPPLFLSAWRSVKAVLGRAADGQGIDPVGLARILVPAEVQPGTYGEVDLLWGLVSEWDDKPDCRGEYAVRIRRFLVSP